MTSTVIGAAVRVGSAVTQRLLDAGTAVHVLVRDPGKARQLFGNDPRLQIIPVRLDDPAPPCCSPALPPATSPASSCPPAAAGPPAEPAAAITETCHHLQAATRKPAEPGGPGRARAPGSRAC